jgi:sirohydrochlorin ferrochelatase
LKQDLPGQIKTIQKKFADLQITLEPPVGEQPEVISAIAKAIAK